MSYTMLVKEYIVSVVENLGGGGVLGVMAKFFGRRYLGGGGVVKVNVLFGL